MTRKVAGRADVVRQQISDEGEVRALRALRRGRVRHLLEVNFTRLASMLGLDDDRQYYRCTEYDTEAELLSAFDRAATAVGR